MNKQLLNELYNELEEAIGKNIKHSMNKRFETEADSELLDSFRLMNTGKNEVEYKKATNEILVATTYSNQTIDADFVSEVNTLFKIVEKYRKLL